MDQIDCFAKLRFTDTQLSAIRQIYNKWFLPKITEEYSGKGFVFVWGEDIVWNTGKGHDVNHQNIGYNIYECNNDPLWGEFEDLLPHMGKTAVITKMPPNKYMWPHVDRKWRPEAIYIPISGCTDLCVSKIYDLPKPDTDNSTCIKEFPENYIYQYAIVDQPYLTNTHIWHSVQNFSSIERTTFGWNFSHEKNYTYQDCKNILSKLGYLNYGQI